MEEPWKQYAKENETDIESYFMILLTCNYLNRQIHTAGKQISSCQGPEKGEMRSSRLMGKSLPFML